MCVLYVYVCACVYMCVPVCFYVDSWLCMSVPLCALHSMCVPVCSCVNSCVDMSVPRSVCVHVPGSALLSQS